MYNCYCLIYIALTALKKCYPIMIDKLPSNHFTTLLRLQDLAVLPGKIVDNIVHSPSAEVGNKMIVDYLIGLVHTEEHVITFCVLAERMLREFDNCICILNLRNSKSFSVNTLQSALTIHIGKHYTVYCRIILIKLILSLALLMSCKLNTSDILTVTEESMVANAVKSDKKPDENMEGLPDTTHQDKVNL